MEFFRCKHCGNIIAYAHSSGVKVMCCGEVMEKIEPNTVDAAQEKHIPVIEQEDNLVKITVSSILHPMTEEHNISWVALETEQGNQRKKLRTDSEPVVYFSLCDGDKVKSAYAYCNLHGLWKQDF